MHIFPKMYVETFMFSYSIIPTDDTHQDLIDAQDDEDEDEDEDILDFKGLTNAQPLWVLPLYSFLPSHKQAKVNTQYIIIHMHIANN